MSVVSKHSEAESGARGEGTPRLWPGIAAVVVMVVGRFLIPAVVPGSALLGVLSVLIGTVAMLVWWTGFSRIPQGERWGVLAVLILGAVVASRFLHESIATSMQGLMYAIYLIPVLCVGLVAWTTLRRSLSRSGRWALLVGFTVLGCGAWTLLRTEGMTGDGRQDFAWRWSPTYEQQLLAQANPSVGSPLANDEPFNVVWSGFRGNHRDGVVRGTQLSKHWSSAPPTEEWRRKIGPACSSFAVSDQFLFTQEQRGDHEAVSCYGRKSGELVWRHQDEVRFWDSHAGAGPRGTPTLHGTLLLAFGGTGLLSALDGPTGKLLWSRNVAKDSAVEVPEWAFSSSPLVIKDKVFVAAAGTLVAYRLEDGELLWQRACGEDGYSSPHLHNRAGMTEVLLASKRGLTSVLPDDGSVIWQFPQEEGARICQPALLPEGDILLSDGEAAGLRRFSVSRSGQSWEFEERWKSIRLKPYLSDFVVHQGAAYGFDGSLLACISLQDGSRQWKGGRYGHGQLLLLADQDLLLLISEQGEVALVSATTGSFQELGRFQALQGKTWNHPVLVQNMLFVRNGQEMATFRLPTESSPSTPNGS